MPVALGSRLGARRFHRAAVWKCDHSRIMATSVKRLLVGKALRTEQAIHERLSKKTALAVFSSDALSSTAYATEEILLVLAVAAIYGQAYVFRYVIPISIGIAVLLAIVAT